MILNYSFSGKIDTEKLRQSVAELLHLDNSKVISISLDNPKEFEISYDYKEFENGTLKSTVDLYFSSNNQLLKQINELDFGVKLSNKLNTELYFLAPDFSAWEIIKVSPKGDLFNGTENYTEDENGEEITIIENLQPLKKKDIVKLHQDFIRCSEIEFGIQCK